MCIVILGIFQYSKSSYDQPVHIIDCCLQTGFQYVCWKCKKKNDFLFGFQIWSGYSNKECMKWIFQKLIFATIKKLNHSLFSFFFFFIVFHIYFDCRYFIFYYSLICCKLLFFCTGCRIFFFLVWTYVLENLYLFIRKTKVNLLVSGHQNFMKNMLWIWGFQSF